ncbi:SPRY domain-containing SOCS box protein 3-like [Physella acuta]|uniref:SPRY domain-containing SOCS box protein 3-like n=1 Tax=Physella acuta TaxID=109671 RepID=UPI0027DC2B7D|nr:SPRY domain-containing SOCS box protein 3-like [Physella acuta]XP_059156965.1 SPRY domain-containing SOCS box protein 3-like [Physella acuta]XP_059156966.1 SPRY domain-containing SOCS box protein 3-like [Physella acuta]XP_059156967.1 SPRY domain-containing SOCS box protein 3-like [Physella acuta]XP_059156968.1 SPRY domain-containing SOCS box protein 3-like [Physella acuta]
MAPEPVLAICMQEVNPQEDDSSVKVTQPDSHVILGKLDISCSAGWSWNQLDSSTKVSVLDDKLGVTFHPHWSNGTAGIRASEPLTGEVNYWEIQVGERVFGTSLMFGVSTPRARLDTKEFKNLLGEDANGWGLSHKGRLYHNGVSTPYCAPFKEYTPVLVGVLFHRLKGELSFFKDGVNLGVAFTGMSSVKDDLYPTICSTAAKTTMAVGKRLRSFHNLQDRCRQVIVNRVKRRGAIASLPLPGKVRDYISYGITQDYISYGITGH